MGLGGTARLTADPTDRLPEAGKQGPEGPCDRKPSPRAPAVSSRRRCRVTRAPRPVSCDTRPGCLQGCVLVCGRLLAQGAGRAQQPHTGAGGTGGSAWTAATAATRWATGSVHGHPGSPRPGCLVSEGRAHRQLPVTCPGLQQSGSQPSSLFLCAHTHVHTRVHTRFLLVTTGSRWRTSHHGAPHVLRQLSPRPCLQRSPLHGGHRGLGAPTPARVRACTLALHGRTGTISREHGASRFPLSPALRSPRRRIWN